MIFSGLSFFALLSVAYAASSSNVSVTLKNGTYTGLSLPSFGQELFLGMPYAQPPLGDLRFRPPQSLNTSFSTPRNATEYSDICIGYPSGGANDDAGFTLSEDCLTINVVRPEGVSEGSDVPVVLWIHGGGFVMGGSADHRYNGTWIVQRSVELGHPIIFTSLNYRLTAFGFLYSQEIAAEGTGNFGLLDQRLGMEWLQENIAAFGGDPSKVTIMGESAGAESVAMQLLAFGETSTNLFRGGIMESGTATTENFPNLNESQAAYDFVVDRTGCASSSDTLACLRSVDVSAIIAATNNTGVGFQPVIDGHFFTQTPTESLNAGQLIKVPLLLGQNTDEGASFGVSHLNNETVLQNQLAESYPFLTSDSVNELLQLYPFDPLIGCPYHTGDGLLSTGFEDKRSFSIYGDIVMHGPRRFLAQTMSKLGQDVFTYRFDQIPDNATVETGIQHFQEVAYVFSNPLPTQNPLSHRAGDVALSNNMTSYWVSFVATQSPNFDGAVTTWPNYREQTENIVFNRHSIFTEQDDYRAAGISFINSLGSQLQH